MARRNGMQFIYENWPDNQLSAQRWFRPPIEPFSLAFVCHMNRHFQKWSVKWSHFDSKLDLAISIISPVSGVAAWTCDRRLARAASSRRTSDLPDGDTWPKWGWEQYRKINIITPTMGCRAVWQQGGANLINVANRQTRNEICHHQTKWAWKLRMIPDGRQRMIAERKRKPAYSFLGGCNHVLACASVQKHIICLSQGQKNITLCTRG